MTKSKAIFNYFNSFGLNAYPSTSVPEEIKFPWATYENVIGNTGDQISTTLQIWYHTDSEAVLNTKDDQISQAIGMGGKVITYDDGAIWIKRGSPWSTPISQGSNSTTKLDSDNSIKGRSLNIEIEFM